MTHKPILLMGVALIALAGTGPAWAQSGEKPGETPQTPNAQSTAAE